MTEMSSVQQLKEIHEAIQHDNRVNLFGLPGAGKTWMAKTVAGRRLYDFTLWAYMCREYNKNSLHDSIARQISLLSTSEEWEVEDDRKGQKEDDETEEISETLVQKIQKKLEGKKILLLLDDVLDSDSEKQKRFWLEWEKMLLGYDKKNSKTVLITRSSNDDQHVSEGTWIKVEALPKDESESLLREKLAARLKESDEIIKLGERFVEKSDRLPGTIMMIAKVLNYFGFDKSGMSMLKKELEEASDKYRVSKLLCRKHDVLPISVLKDVCWRGPHFFRDSGSVHYSELITYWILEGYLGFGSVTKLFEAGHRVLMELIDCGILKRQEGGYVFMDKTLLNVDDLYQCVDC